MADKRKKFSDSQKESMDSTYSSEEKSSSSSGTETAPETADDRELAAVMEVIRRRVIDLGPLAASSHPEHYNRVFIDRIYNFFMPAVREFTFNCKGSQNAVNILQVVCDRLKHLCRNGIWKVEFDEVYAEVENARATFIGALSEPENRLLESLLSFWYHCYVRIRGSLRYARLYQTRLFTDQEPSAAESADNLLQSEEPTRNLCFQLNKELVSRMVKNTVEAVEAVFEWFRPSDPFQPTGLVERIYSEDSSEEETETETLSAASI